MGHSRESNRTLIRLFYLRKNPNGGGRLRTCGISFFKFNSLKEDHVEVPGVSKERSTMEFSGVTKKTRNFHGFWFLTKLLEIQRGVTQFWGMSISRWVRDESVKRESGIE